MKEDTIIKLNNVIVKSKGRADGFYWKTEEYKTLNEIYMSDKKGTVDILSDIVLRPNPQDEYDNESAMSILECMIWENERDNNDLSYLKSKFREMIIVIFEDPGLVKCRKFLNESTNSGFNAEEELILFKKYIKIETDTINVKHFKYRILALELSKKFAEQSGFLHPTSTLELNQLNEPTNVKVERMQNYINAEIKEYGVDSVKEYLKFFYNHKYTKDGSKAVLREIKIDGDVI